MTNDKLKNVWKIMKDIRLQFDQRSDNEICCVICNRTLINAHSSPCGCRYCLECIQGYLNEGDQICPGNTDNCTDELLNMDRDIHIDQPMNRKIFKTIVKCPEDNCEFKDELRNIEDHLQISHNQLVNCPYFNIGCNLSGIKSKDVKNHLLAEIVSHNQMMFQVIENLQKDNKDLRESIIHLESKYEKENREMNEKLKDMEKNKLIEVQYIIQESQIKYEKQNQELTKNVKDLKESLFNLQWKQEHDNNEVKDKLKEMEKNKLTEVQKYIQDFQVKYEKQNQELTKNIKETLINLQSKQESDNRDIFNKLKEMDKNKSIEVQKCILNCQRNYEKDIQEIMKNVKDQKEKYENENREIKEKLKEMEKNKLIEKSVQESQIKYERQNQELTKNFKDLKNSLNNLQSKQKGDKVEINKKLKEFEQYQRVEKHLKNWQTKHERQNQEILRSVKGLENKIVQEKRDNETKFDEINNNIAISTFRYFLFSNHQISELEHKMDLLERNQALQNCGEFVWIIDKWEMRSINAKHGIDEQIFSDPFYTHKNGYKMCLSVFPFGYHCGEGSHLSIGFHLMCGEFDYSLPWPFTRDVTIELIDQNTGLAYISQTISHDSYINTFKRPLSGRNMGFKISRFLSLRELWNNPALIHNFQIVIKCNVKNFRNHYYLK